MFGRGAAVADPGAFGPAGGLPAEERAIGVPAAPRRSRSAPQPVASRHPQTGYRLGASEPRVPPSLGVAGRPVNDLV